MARGGPETPLRPTLPEEVAIEQAIAPKAIALDAGGLGPDMGVPPIMANDRMGDFSTNTTGAPPPIPAPEKPTGDQPRRRGGLDMGPIGRPTLRDPNLNTDYRYTQRDFYGNNPTITATDPVGRQMYVPSFGELPYAVMASQLQEKKAERAQTQKALNDLLNPKFDPTAPQYEAEFAAYVNKGIADDIAAQVAAHGGDRSEALRYLTESNEGKAWWSARNRMRNAVGQEAKYVADDWADILSQQAKGLLYLTPEDKKLGEEIVRGYTSLGTDKEEDLPSYLNKVQQGKRVIGRDQFVKQFIVPAIDELAQDTETIEKPYRIAGGRLVIPVSDRRNYDQLIDSQARAMTEADMFDHVDDAKEWLRDRFPADVKVQAIVRDPITSPSSGDGDKPKAPTVVASVAERPAAADKGAVRGPQAELRLTPYQQTGDKMHKVAKMNVTTGGRSQDLYAPSLTYDEATNDWRLSGVSLSETEKAEFRNKVADLSRQGTSDVDVVTDIIMTSNMGKPFSTSIRENGDAMEVYWGTRDPYEVVAKQLQGARTKEAPNGWDVTAEQVAEKWKDKLQRNRLIGQLR